MGTQTYGYLLYNGVYSSYRLVPYDEFHKYYRNDERILELNECYWLNISLDFDDLNELKEYLAKRMKVKSSSIKDIQLYEC